MHLFVFYIACKVYSNPKSIFYLSIETERLQKKREKINFWGLFNLDWHRLF